MKNILTIATFACLSGLLIGSILPLINAKKDAGRKKRIHLGEEKTKYLLENEARSEIDFLTKKYDIEILQDQLNKNKHLSKVKQ